MRAEVRMDELYNLSFAFALAATFICLANICFIRIQGRMGKPQNKLFMMILITLALNGICNTVTGFLTPYRHTSETALFVTQAARYLYFVFHTMLAPLFFLYISSVCGIFIRSVRYKRIIYYGVFAITELLALTNPLTHWVYYLDSDLQFRRSWGEALIYLAAAFFLAIAIKNLTNTWHVLTFKRKAGVLMFTSITIAGILIQLLFHDVKVELFAEAIGLTGIMMIIENEDDRIENVTGLYNRQAFLTDLESYMINRTKLHVISIRINTPEIVSRKRGAVNRELLEKSVADFLSTVHKRYNIYRLGRRSFAMTVFSKDDEEAYALAQKVSTRFDKPWKLTDTFVMLSASIILADIPRQVDTLNDALYMFESEKPSKTDKKILAGDDLNFLLRGSAVEKSITHGLSEGKFEVYYQPTYSMDGLKLHGAEALVRLHDDDMGMLYPDEFIPVAENMGLIDAIDDHVLMDVCRLIRDERLYEKGIDCINVNLSVLQFMKQDFVEHINGIVEEAGIDKKYINFEVTESISGGSYEILNNAINELKREGFMFSMDDYGTGYSNMRALASMNLDCIKIDKSILWEAEKSELGYIILENSIRMIHQMNKNILVEGVETESQIKLLEPLGVNYLQGYYFSKPVPKDKFLAIVEKENSAGK